MLGPILLTYGLTKTSAANASLLLNLEAVLSALVAWIVFRENAGRRVVTGMMLIVAGGICLALSQGGVAFGSLRGVLAITGACLCWAADNNLTRKISGCDAVFVASANFSIAPFLGAAMAVAIFHEPVSTAMWISALLMAVGLMLHSLEQHVHEHDHEPLTHSHAHHPDIHHRHRHQTLDAQNH